MYNTRKGERASVVFAFLVLSACKVLRHGPPEDAGAPIESINVASAASVASSAPSESASADTLPSVSPEELARAARLQALQEALNGSSGTLGDIFGDAGYTDPLATSHGHGGLVRAAHSPSLRLGAFNVNGRLPPEVIQRIVRQNFGRFRLCYQTGLTSNPTLQGRVTSQFVIDRSGNVSIAKDSGSDLPDASVVQCVVSAFKNLSFPVPEGGIVVVTAPIIFSPGT